MSIQDFLKDKGDANTQDVDLEKLAKAAELLARLGYSWDGQDWVTG